MLMLRQYQEDGFVMDMRRLAPLIKEAWSVEESKQRFEDSAQVMNAGCFTISLKIAREAECMCGSID